MLPPGKKRLASTNKLIGGLVLTFAVVGFAFPFFLMSGNRLQSRQAQLTISLIHFPKKPTTSIGVVCTAIRCPTA
jgi:hypothetical protein